MAKSALTLPALTEYDSKLSNDGSIDPLGLYPISEALATLLCPGVRQRMKNPRFLTLMAVGSSVITPLQREDHQYAEGSSPPYQVFEWFTVKGLVRRVEDPTEIAGLPGGFKAKQAIDEKVHLSAARYLKVASVFGFFGIYRPLARQLDILNEDHILGSFGSELVAIWERENNLPGFLAGRDGEGARWRRELTKAVETGLAEGHANRPQGWDGWKFFADYLRPRQVSRAEADAIYQKILNTNVETPHRRPLLDFLTSKAGKNVWSTLESERAFHLEFMKNADRDLKNLLEAILAYEQFSRDLQNGFEHCMQTLSDGRPHLKISDLAQLRGVIEAAQKLPDSFRQARECLEPYGLGVRFSEGFSCYGESLKPLEWVRLMLTHHQKVQRNKPPHGKKPWVLMTDKGDECIIDPNYDNNQRYAPQFDGSYVNFYRTASLWSFCSILGVI